MHKALREAISSIVAFGVFIVVAYAVFWLGVQFGHAWIGPPPTSPIDPYEAERRAGAGMIVGLAGLLVGIFAGCVAAYCTHRAIWLWTAPTLPRGSAPPPLGTKSDTKQKTLREVISSIVAFGVFIVVALAVSWLGFRFGGDWIGPTRTGPFDEPNLRARGVLLAAVLVGCIAAYCAHRAIWRGTKRDTNPKKKHGNIPL